MAEAYSLGVARTVVAQLAEGAGFGGGVQASAAETLADLLLRFIAEGSAGARTQAELANRSVVNVADLAVALHDMRSTPKALQKYAEYLKQDEVPFAQSIAAYPKAKRPRPVPSFADKQEVPPAHIPSFMPAFPDQHTYLSTPVYPGHDKDPKRVREKLNKQRQSAAKAVINQHARIEQSQGDAAASALPSQGLGPFFAAPLWEESLAAGPANVKPGRKQDAGEAAAEPMEIDPAQLKAAAVTNSGSAWADTDVASRPAAVPAVSMLGPLNWGRTLRRKALISTANMPFEDATNEDEQAAKEGTPAAGADKARKRKPSGKGAAAGSEKDPGASRAEKLLAAAEASAAGEPAEVAPHGAEVL